MEPKRLYRSRKNKWIAGVCGGVAEYFNIDPIIVRILAIIIPGFGWVLYLILALIVPEDPTGF
ncbi:MAG: PspC domain-containing protein [Oscillospiraceae bacterium]|nr:PspC domain-containing protein [Oscillospiraceae bacterium]